MPHLVLIILLAAFPALSTDMYLPAIPALQSLWGVSLAEANLSLSLFFLCFSLFLLVHGPLSDRFGRKPVLLAGIVCYVAGSLACAGAQSLAQLVAARMLQAAGAAAAATLALALAKDLYSGHARQKALAWIGVIVPLCPMVAPMIGGFLLKVVSWRAIFLLQALSALPALYGGLRLAEPTFERSSGGLVAVFRRYGVLLKNGPFLVLALAFAFMATGFYAFIGGSADIYIAGFGVGEQAFGLFFGFNALGLMAGSFLASRLCVGIASRTILHVSLAGILLGALAMLVLNGASPAAFALPMFTVSFFLGMNRPISNSMILDHVPSDVGAASAFMTCANFLLGALAMEAVSLGGGFKIAFIGVLALAGAVIPLWALRALRGPSGTFTERHKKGGR
jgi:DHA1 family bicyclomycin/chloramphenicol resistance-like MFS transporter